MATPSPAIVSYGAVLSIRATATSGAYTEIPGCSDFELSPSWSEANKTAHKSNFTLPAMEKVKTLLDEGTLSFTLRLDMSQPTHVLLRNAFRSPSAWGFTYTTSDPSMETATFLANVMEFPQSDPVDGVREVNVSLSITGEIAFS